MVSIRSTLMALAISATALALPQDPTDPAGQDLPRFEGDGISFITGQSGTITAYSYSGGPAWGCLDATGHVDKSGKACATFVTSGNSTYGSALTTTNGPCAFNPNDQWKFQCKDMGADVKPTSFYQIGPWLAHGYYKKVTYEAWYNWRGDVLYEIISGPSSSPVQYTALFKFQPLTSST